MAAAEYYMGANAQELPGNNHSLHAQPAQPQPQPPQFQQSPAQPYAGPHHNASYSNMPPPTYSPFPNPPQQQQQQMQAFVPPQPPSHLQSQHTNNVRPANIPPYPTGPPLFPPPPRQSNSYLGAPIQPQRSHSQPPPQLPHVRFANNDSDHSDSGSYSDSDESPRRRHRHRRHDRSRDRDLSGSDRDSHRHHRNRDTKIQSTEHKERDTFLGAGVGGVIGDVIFPGLGTAAGLLIGGLGGRKYGKRSKSEEVHHHRHRDAFREGQEESRADRARYEDSGRRHQSRDSYYGDKEGSRPDSHHRSRDYSDSEDDVESGYGRHRKSGAHKGFDKETGRYKRGLTVR